MKERIPGGLASGMKPSDFDAKELARGAAIESEHTTDVEVAIEIAMDHLVEDPHYYRKLERMERKKGRPRKVRNTQRVNQLVRDLVRPIYGGK